jgi:hypothetical protein
VCRETQSFDGKIWGEKNLGEWQKDVVAKRWGRNFGRGTHAKGAKGRKAGTNAKAKKREPLINANETLIGERNCTADKVGHVYEYARGERIEQDVPRILSGPSSGRNREMAKRCCGNVRK